MCVELNWLECDLWVQQDWWWSDIPSLAVKLKKKQKVFEMKRMKLLLLIKFYKHKYYWDEIE